MMTPFKKKWWRRKMKKRLTKIVVFELTILFILTSFTVIISGNTEKINLGYDPGDIIPIVFQRPLNDLKTRNIIYVDDDNTGGPWDGSLEHPYRYLHDGVDSANTGDTVFVFNGTYSETGLILNDAISLIGENRQSTIIDGNAYQNVLTVYADNVTISGFTIKNSGTLGYDSGIMLFSNNNTITDNIIRENGGLAPGEQPGAGVFLYESSHNTIAENDISHNRYYNLYLYIDCFYNDIENNTINQNDYHHNVAFYYSDHNNFTGNTIEHSFRTGIYLWESQQNRLEDNYLNDHYYGAIKLGEYSNNNTVVHNTIFNGNIYIDTSSYNLLEGNDISWYLFVGINIGSSSMGNTIVDNTISYCAKGVSISQTCSDNIMYHNRFSHNDLNAEDYGSNVWDNGYPSGGNKWDDYTGEDFFSGPNQDIPGSDGIGDTPYHIPQGDNFDYYPLYQNSSPQTIVYVDDDFNETTQGWGVDHFNDIQQGIDHVNPGGIVYVYNGIYQTNVFIEKSISVFGQERATTIIQGLGVASTVTLDADGVIFSGFTVQRSGSTVFDAVVEVESDNNLIINNVITGGDADGIALDECTGNQIINNYFHDNQGYPSDAIYLENAQNNIIARNIVSHNHEGVALEWGSHHNFVNDNTICNNLLDGISVWQSSYNTIGENTITGNGYNGMYVKDCYENTLFQNNISDNGRNGIYLYLSANYNTVFENTIQGNVENGIWIDSSNDNHLYHNNLIQNTQQGADSGFNVWDDGYPSAGNYWSDYTGDDEYSGPDQNISGGDGIGDTPYEILGGSNHDQYPLIEQYGSQYPHAEFMWNPTNPLPGESIVFDASSSYDLSGYITLYEWDWNNDGVYEQSSSVPAIIHVWNATGSYRVTLRVTDNLSFTGKKSRIIDVVSEHPSVPVIHGPSTGIMNVEYEFTTEPIQNPTGDYLFCKWDWDDGNISGWLGPYASGSVVSASHGWVQTGMYEIRAKLKDPYEVESDWSAPYTITIVENNPPTSPSIDGPLKGKTGISYDYTFVSSDPDGASVWYYVDWGDNSTSGWLGKYNSGEEIVLNHTWNVRGTFQIRCKAKDSYNIESDWGMLSVTMPLDLQEINRSHSQQVILQFVNQLLGKMSQRVLLN
jgi:nitrous oxidase accessory protein